MPTAAENLRARFNPEWKSRIEFAGLHGMLESALNIAAAPQVIKTELEAPGTLNPRGVAEALRGKLSRSAVPELRRNLRVISERKAALPLERAALSAPKVDKNDVSAALLRQEARAYLRGLDPSARMLALMQNPPDPTLLAAALEAPTLAGLTNGMKEDVEKAYVKAHHAPKLRTLDELQEALDLVGAAAEIAAMNIRNGVDLPPHEFDRWFATANGDRALAAE